MRRRCRLFAALVVTMSVSGCDAVNDLFFPKHDELDEPLLPRPQAASPPASTSQRKTPATGARTSVSASASASASALNPIFAKRSEAPTVDEWLRAGLATPPLRVAGAAALGCEATTVREWLRITCGKATRAMTGGVASNEGPPTGAMISDGSSPEAFTERGDEGASIVVRVFEGVHVVASVVWKAEVHRFEIFWRKGAPPPDPMGVFSPSPIGAPPGTLTCTCALEVRGTTHCDATTVPYDLDCERTYSRDCGKLLACEGGKIGALPACEVGTALDGRGRCKVL